MKSYCRQIWLVELKGDDDNRVTRSAHKKTFCLTPRDYSQLFPLISRWLIDVQTREHANNSKSDRIGFSSKKKSFSLLLSPPFNPQTRREKSKNKCHLWNRVWATCRHLSLSFPEKLMMPDGMRNVKSCGGRPFLLSTLSHVFVAIFLPLRFNLHDA